MNELNNKIKIFCLPYAGAGPSLYAAWKKNISDRFEIIPVTIPGREARIREPLITDCAELVEKIFEENKDRFCGHFYIFGHSMGGFLSYELAFKIFEEKGFWPDKLLLSATTLWPDRTYKVSEMNEQEFADYLIKTEGIEKVLAENEDFKKFYFPIIKADYTLVEKYECKEKKLGCAVHAFASRTDKVVPFTDTENIKRFTDDFSLTEMSGNHFYIRKESKKIIETIENL